ncbi:unnamed protein product [Trypanosoma congolense IL3000]|uniref:WGS project CAEQ00000000 data, annotated contig 1139 n=1 Tax=Trypanosoma congolense (strain IL3000) TaxID=1068625 RepID=F9W424_TRYCI|nr:unnamed protein product [Trypanosoma congolense IL3000]
MCLIKMGVAEEAMRDEIIFLCTAVGRWKEPANDGIRRAAAGVVRVKAEFEHLKVVIRLAGRMDEIENSSKLIQDQVKVWVSSGVGDEKVNEIKRSVITMKNDLLEFATVVQEEKFFWREELIERLSDTARGNVEDMEQLCLMSFQMLENNGGAMELGNVRRMYVDRQRGTKVFVEACEEVVVNLTAVGERTQVLIAMFDEVMNQWPMDPDNLR